MHRFKFKLALRSVVFALPYAVLMVAGCLWLYERHLFFYFVCVTAGLSAAGWLLVRWIRPRSRKAKPTPAPVETWPEAGNAAWADIDSLAANAEANPPAFDDLNAHIKVFQEVFEIVARRFHPNSKEPALEVPLTDVLEITERVARDFRKQLREQVPLADEITIHNLRRLAKLGPLANQLSVAIYNIYRVARLAFNPYSALVNEAQTAISGGSVANLLEDLPRMAAGYCVRRAGYYAIQLYSGQIALDRPEFADLGADKPLRIVILGQTKAGKSSLINALFGEVRAAIDTIPCTASITPYVLDRKGFPQAILFDTIGFAGSGDRSARDKLDAELAQCDLVIMVSSAASAARGPDQKLLAEARLKFSHAVQRAAPPIVVALSHIDQLRPINEWSPPYDFENGDSLKERNTRDAVNTVAKDLQIAYDQIVPVCLREDARYNVDQRLMPVIAKVLPEGERAKLLRLLLESRKVEQREALRQQLLSAGLSIVQIGAQFVGRKIVPPSKQQR